MKGSNFEDGRANLFLRIRLPKPRTTTLLLRYAPDGVLLGSQLIAFVHAAGQHSVNIGEFSKDDKVDYSKTCVKLKLRLSSS